MSNISFFYDAPAEHADISGSRHLKRGTSIIRGEQIAKALGAKCNPESGFENDIHIYIKPVVQRVDRLVRAGRYLDQMYIDVIDGWGLTVPIDTCDKIKLIACSEQSARSLKERHPNNTVVMIPQHHCNFDRIRREREGITVIGSIGAPFVRKRYFPEKGIIEGLKDRGIEFKFLDTFLTREDVVDFYKSIDLQIVWRPYQHRLPNPLKVINAASFGIPSIALKERRDTFGEVKNCCIQVRNLGELFKQVDNLVASPEIYNKYVADCIDRSEAYHIDKIVEFYKKLK